jgi:predicted RNA-binding protein with PIN domain
MLTIEGFGIFAGHRIVIVFDAQASVFKEAQREQLTDLVEVVFACGGAQMRPCPERRKSSCASDTPDLCGTTGCGTADEFIEKYCVDLSLTAEKPLIYVATADRLSGNVSAGAGAVLISGTTLLRYVRKSDEDAKEVLRRQHAQNLAQGGARLTQRLDKSTATSLLALRAQLNEQAKIETRRQRKQ